MNQIYSQKTLSTVDLTIAISTHEERIHQAIKLASSLSNIAPVMVVHQTQSDFPNLAIPDSINYVRINSVGVSKSRNIAINSATSKFLWFLDDDVSVDIKKSKGFIEDIVASEHAIDVITIGVLDENGVPRKKFPNRKKKHSLLSIISVGTIEVIINRKRIIEHGCYFPEDMGAGSNLPVADEPVFLANCLKKNLSVHFFPAFFLSHPRESSGGNFENILASKARGVAFRRIYGISIGLILLTAMYLKKATKGTLKLTNLLKNYRLALSGLFYKK